MDSWWIFFRGAKECDRMTNIVQKQKLFMSSIKDKMKAGYSLGSLKLLYT